MSYNKRRFQRDNEILKQLIATENHLKARELEYLFGSHFTKHTNGIPNTGKTVVGTTQNHKNLYGNGVTSKARRARR